MFLLDSGAGIPRDAIKSRKINCQSPRFSTPPPMKKPPVCHVWSITLCAHSYSTLFAILFRREISISPGQSSCGWHVDWWVFQEYPTLSRVACSVMENRNSSRFGTRISVLVAQTVERERGCPSRGLGYSSMSAASVILQQLCFFFLLFLSVFAIFMLLIVCLFFWRACSRTQEIDIYLQIYGSFPPPFSSTFGNSFAGHARPTSVIGANKWGHPTTSDPRVKK